MLPLLCKRVFSMHKHLLEWVLVMFKKKDSLMYNKYHLFKTGKHFATSIFII